MQGVKGYRPSPRHSLPRHQMVESIVDRRCLLPPHRNAQFFLRRGFAEFDDVWHNGVGGKKVKEVDVWGMQFSVSYWPTQGQTSLTRIRELKDVYSACTPLHRNSFAA